VNDARDGRGPRLGLRADPDPILERYLEERDRLLSRAEPGLRAAEELSRLTDGLVEDLTAAAASRLGTAFAIVALGGWGAGRLLPGSDIDILIVGETGGRSLASIADDLLYPLWDTGITVGHQVRTRKEHLRAVKQDLTVLTSTLTGRVVAGDRRLGEGILSEVASWSAKRIPKLAGALFERKRPGSPYLLEPDLKEGAGGQRDLDELTWLAALVSGAPARDASQLASFGLLSPHALSTLSGAQESLALARWALQLLGTRPPSLMTLDGAETAGIDTPALQCALTDVHHTLLSVRDRVLGRPASSADDPWTPDALLEALEEGERALPELERASWHGLLDEVLPGFRDLMTVHRPALSHRYTVGAHSLRAAASLAGLGEKDEMAPAVLADIADRGPLVVAALTHDAGKSVPGPGHASRGASFAEDVARRFGLSSPLRWGVRTLVAEHLLLSETATQADLSDEDVVLRTAARLGDRSLVGPLYLLTVADSLATGPDVWTPWRASLVRELTAKIDAALADDIDGVGIVSAAERTRREALREASGRGMERSVTRFLEEAPLRYLATRRADEVIRHATLVRELRGPLGAAGVAIDVTPGAAEGTWRLTVATGDRRGLFALIAGVLSVSNLDILAASAFTEASGVVLDVFVVRSATLAPVEHETWSLVERRLRAAIAGHFDVESRLAEKRRHHRAAGPMRAPSVTLDTSYPLATVVRVRAADRPGFLHDMALTLDGAGLDIRMATVETSDGVAVDTFHVVDETGAPLREAPVLEETRALLVTASGVPGES
jgi:[protein-PII] uridylyltransferase